MDAYPMQTAASQRKLEIIFKQQFADVVGAELLPLYIDASFAPDDWVMLRFHIEKLRKRRRKLTCVEIGSFLGKTSIFLSQLLTEDSILYCVDPWSLSPDLLRTLPVDRVYDGKSGEFLFNQFLSNVCRAETNSTVAAIRSPGLEAARNWPGTKVDLLWIDGDHSAQAVIDDVTSWLPFVQDGGIMCGDDYKPSYEGHVAEALEYLLENGTISNVFTYHHHWWCVLNRSSTQRSIRRKRLPQLLWDMVSAGCYTSAWVAVTKRYFEGIKSIKI